MWLSPRFSAVDDRLDDVDDEDFAARLGEGRGERQADVAGADDRDVIAHDRATLAAKGDGDAF